MPSAVPGCLVSRIDHTRDNKQKYLFGTPMMTRQQTSSSVHIGGSRVTAVNLALVAERGLR